MSRDSVAVRIAGHEYRIRSDGEPESLREIAGYVDRAMTRVRDRTGTVDSLDVAVLTCLNLAREILALHESRLPEGATAIEGARLRSLIESVEATLGGNRAAASEEVGEAAGAAEPSAEPGEGAAPARTLELPSFEALRDRGEAEAEAEGVIEPRVAAGGRDRAS